MLYFHETQRLQPSFTAAQHCPQLKKDSLSPSGNTSMAQNNQLIQGLSLRFAGKRSAGEVDLGEPEPPEVV